jgi:hypothetical protein
MKEQADKMVAEKSGIHMEVMRLLGTLRDSGKVTPALKSIREQWAEPDEELLTHWAEINEFKIRSSPKMGRWLFKIMGLQPVKSTKNPKEGIPSMLWVKVLELPEKLQANFTPAGDKETIEILQEQDDSGMLTRLLAECTIFGVFTPPPLAGLRDA